MPKYDIIRFYYLWEVATVEADSREDVEDMDKDELQWKEIERDYQDQTIEEHW